MVNLESQCLVWCNNLVPPVVAREPQDFIVSEINGVATITKWNTGTLGAQPTAQQLAAITQQNIDDYYRTVAKAAATIAIDLNPGYEKRAIAGMAIQEINSLRDWITSFKSAVAAATTLADLKTRVAALSDMPDRTQAQAKAAYKNLLAGNTLDE